MTLIKNAWYIGAWAYELDDGPVGRVIVGQPVGFFRDQTGAAIAINDACPHRGVPLSSGSVVDGRIKCPYHGLEFDGEGVCRHNPHIKGRPEAIKTKTFPVIERYQALWVWVGDPNLADPDAMPDYDWFDSDELHAVRGYVKIDADYRFVIDNLMDLSHAEYIHPNTLGTPDASQNQQAEVVREGNAIAVNALWPDAPPNAVNKAIWTRSEHIDQYLDMKWQPPSSLVMNLGIMEPGHPRESGYRTPSAHILAPESERSTHYFWAFARDFDKDNPHIDDVIRNVVTTAFMEEDKPAIEAAQRMLDLTGQDLLNFTVGDAGSRLVRQEIDRLAQLEQ